MVKKLPLLAGFGAGYVLGARAGRERYNQIAGTAQQVLRDPRLQAKARQVQHVAQEKAGQAAHAAKDKATSAASSDSGTPTGATSSTSGTPS